MKKIVITGIGMVTPVGNGKAAIWNAIKAGTCGREIHEHNKPTSPYL